MVQSQHCVSFVYKCDFCDWLCIPICDPLCLKDSVITMHPRVYTSSRCGRLWYTLLQSWSHHLTIYLQWPNGKLRALSLYSSFYTIPLCCDLCSDPDHVPVPCSELWSQSCPSILFLHPCLYPYPVSIILHYISATLDSNLVLLLDYSFVCHLSWPLALFTGYSLVCCLCFSYLYLPLPMLCFPVGLLAHSQSKKFRFWGWLLEVKYIVIIYSEEGIYILGLTDLQYLRGKKYSNHVPRVRNTQIMLQGLRMLKEEGNSGEKKKSADTNHVAADF